MNEIHVIGAGLAGSEAAYQIAQKGLHVILHEMKPGKKTPAHCDDGFGELICSNSLRSNRLENAVGLLKEEMRRLGSLIMQAADKTAVPAGGALAVDRKQFSQFITNALKTHPNVTVVEEEVQSLAAYQEKMLIVATGPLTQGKMAEEIQRLTGKEGLFFFDAVAPIVTKESIDMGHAFSGSRYDRGDDYLNCPMEKEEYEAFYGALLGAECAKLHDFDHAGVFEGCMPLEEMARRGMQTLLFGPLKPVGLKDPKTGKMPYAVVQLRKEDREGRLYNLVGFQTHLTFPEQKRVFSMIPALHKGEFVRFGVMHRNTYLQSPGLLDQNYRLKKQPNVFFAGQITGVEGYVESAASGLLAGCTAACDALGKPAPAFSDATAIGALGQYVSQSPSANFQPMNINFGIMQPADQKIRKKAERNLYLAKRALKEIDAMKETEDPI